MRCLKRPLSNIKYTNFWYRVSAWLTGAMAYVLPITSWSACSLDAGLRQSSLMSNVLLRLLPKHRPKIQRLVIGVSRKPLLSQSTKKKTQGVQKQCIAPPSSGTSEIKQRLFSKSCHFAIAIFNKHGGRKLFMFMSGRGDPGMLEEHLGRVKMFRPKPSSLLLLSSRGVE